MDEELKEDGVENEVSKGGHVCVWERMGKEIYKEMSGKMSKRDIERNGFNGYG